MARWHCARRLTASAGVALLAFQGAPALGQTPPGEAPLVPTENQVAAQEFLAQAGPAQPAPKEAAAPPAKQAAPPAPSPPAAASGDQGAPSPGETASLAAPNIIGDLLGAGHSISFFVNRSSKANFLNAVGATNVVNPAVADNNSPVPQDRAYFRFNHFANALSVTGASSQPPVPFPGAPNTLLEFTTTRQYDADLYTFGFEKTFLDRRASLEFRLPFSTTLAPDLNLGYGALTSDATVAELVPNGTGRIYRDVMDTPQNTLGHAATQFGDLTFIFKWLFLQRQGYYLSGGFATTIPTGNDTRVRVTDLLGPSPTTVDTVRVRDFLSRNQTWSMAPYLAALVAPSERWFGQGFVQFDLPLNPSAITYSDVIQHTVPPPSLGSGNGSVVMPLVSTHEHLREQYLVHADVGLGYWLVRRPDAPRLTGFAPAVELHYTTTLNDADVVTLPSDTSKFLATSGKLTPAPPPQVGNLRNRLDILDLTLGTTFEFAGRTRVATAFSLPLRGADNRTYEWEFHLQVNYYFGAPRGGRLPVPSF